jgi:hypothetical protein
LETIKQADLYTKRANRARVASSLVHCDPNLRPEPSGVSVMTAVAKPASVITWSSP